MLRGRQRTALTLLALLLAASVLAPAASAQVQSHRVRDADGEPLARVLYDDSKAISKDTTRGFVVMVRNLNATHGLNASLEVLEANATAFNVTEAPDSELVPPEGSRGLTFKLHARASAVAGSEHEVAFRVHLAPGNATGANATGDDAASGNATAGNSTATNGTAEAGPPVNRTFRMNITVSSLPTPLGETQDTLTVGERVAAGLALAGVAAVVGRRVYRRLQ